MACAEHLVPFEKILSEYFPSDALTLLDPLQDLKPSDNINYYQYWTEQLTSTYAEVDILVGFSLGGVILQQSFGQLAALRSTLPKIVLFSTPSFINADLRTKLDSVISLIQAEKLVEAYTMKMQYILAPLQTPAPSPQFDNPKLATQRLLSGLQRIVTTCSEAQLTQGNTPEYVQFVGEYSQLVNQENVLSTKSGTLVVVPNAGMRVLEDNPQFCHKKLQEICA
jgi:hypothetical protein